MISTVFRLLNDFLFFTDVNVPTVKNNLKKLTFCWHFDSLRATAKTSRIRIQIRIKMSGTRNTAF
jgi:hypothetical protein